MPWLDRVLKKNPLYLLFTKPTNPLTTHTLKLLKDRIDNPPKDPTRRDMYSMHLEAQKANPDFVTDALIVRYLFTNIVAGSDTTALAMRSIIYHTLRKPSVVVRLQKELDSANLTYPPDFRTAQGLPYLDAVIREGLRIHPVVGFSLERLVSETGLELPDGRKLPAGCIVAMNPWTWHFDRSIFGEDCDTFRPERWLRGEGESGDAFQRRLSAMKRADFTFSYGPRVCLGRHIATLEIYKAIPTLFGCLQMRLANPDREWKVESRFIAKQSDMDIKICWRDGVDVHQMTSVE